MGNSNFIFVALRSFWTSHAIWILGAFLILPTEMHADFWPEEIDKRITQSKLMGKKPVIWVDLDGTLFSTSIRIHNILKDYDASRGSQLFQDFPLAELTRLETADEVTHNFLLKRLTPAEAERVSKEVSQFLYDNRFTPSVASRDKVYQPLFEKIKQWEQAGAEIRFLSGRDERLRLPTEQVLTGHELSHIPLHIKEPETPSGPFKRKTMEDYHAQNPNAESIALFEDDAKNRIAVYETFPEIVVLNITQLENEMGLDAPEIKPLFESTPSSTFDTSARYAKQIDKWNYRYRLGRAQTHAQILNTFTEKPTRQTRPWILFTAGTFASGKTTVLKEMEKFNYFDPKETVWIDPDRIRSQIPEFNAFKILDKENAGAFVQIETGYMQELLLEAALRHRENIIVEGTLRSPDWWQVEFKRLRQLYPEFRIGILSVSTSTQTAFERMKERGRREGRFIPEETFKRISSEIPDSVRILTPLADFRIDIDNNTEPKITRILNGVDSDQSFSNISVSQRDSHPYRIVSRLLNSSSPQSVPKSACPGSFAAVAPASP